MDSFSSIHWAVVNPCFWCHTSHVSQTESPRDGQGSWTEPEFAVPVWILWVAPLISHLVPSLTTGSLQLTILLSQLGDLLHASVCMWSWLIYSKETILFVGFFGSNIFASSHQIQMFHYKLKGVRKTVIIFAVFAVSGHWEVSVQLINPQLSTSVIITRGHGHTLFHLSQPRP